MSDLVNHLELGKPVCNDSLFTDGIYLIKRDSNYTLESVKEKNLMLCNLNKEEREYELLNAESGEWRPYTGKTLTKRKADSLILDTLFKAKKEI